MTPHLEPGESLAPESFVVEVFTELDESTVRARWNDVNVLLRLSILSGLQMQLEATLNMLCDFASEIVSFDLGMVYFWDEDEQRMHLRVTRSLVEVNAETYERGNILNIWAAKHARPLLVTAGLQPVQPRPDGSAVSGDGEVQRPVSAPRTSPVIVLPVTNSATARRSAPLIRDP